MWLFMIGADPQGPIYKPGWIGDHVIEATLRMHEHDCISTSSVDIHRHYDVAILAMALPAGSHTTKQLRYIINTLMRQIKIVQIRYIRSTIVVHKESGHDGLCFGAMPVRVSVQGSKIMPTCMGCH